VFLYVVHRNFLSPAIAISNVRVVKEEGGEDDDLMI
jgi:hypothetical protein